MRTYVCYFYEHIFHNISSNNIDLQPEFSVTTIHQTICMHTDRRYFAALPLLQFQISNLILKHDFIVQAVHITQNKDGTNLKNSNQV